MTVGELFINLGIKGAATVGGALSNVQKGLGDISSAGLAAKAALLAVVYGVEHAMSASSKHGAQLQIFANQTGLSTQELQKWQLASERAGNTAEDMQGSVAAVQSTMLDMLAGKGAPAGMGIFARAVGFDPARARETFYVMDKLKEFAKIAPPDLGNSVLKSFGLSMGTIGAMRSKVFAPEKVKAGEILSDSEVARLTRLNAGFQAFHNTLRIFWDKKVSFFGGSILTEVGNALQMIMKLESATESAFRRIPALGVAAKAALVGLAVALMAFGTPIMALSAAITALILLLSDLKKGKEGLIGGTLEQFSQKNEKEKTFQEKIAGEQEKAPIWQRFLSFISSMSSEAGALGEMNAGYDAGYTWKKGFAPIEPKVTPLPKAAGTTSTNNIVNVTVEAKENPREQGDIIGRHINKARGQMPQGGQ